MPKESDKVAEVSAKEIPIEATKDIHKEPEVPIKIVDIQTSKPNSNQIAEIQDSDIAQKVVVDQEMAPPAENEDMFDSPVDFGKLSKISRDLNDLKKKIDKNKKKVAK